MYSRSFVRPTEQEPSREELLQRPRREARSVKSRQRRAPAEEPPPEAKVPKKTRSKRPAPSPPPEPVPEPPREQPRGGRRRLRRRPAPPPPPPLPEPERPPVPCNRGLGGVLDGLKGLLGNLSTQDLLLIGLIFTLTMEGADDDIVFILLALLFISSGE